MAFSYLPESKRMVRWHTVPAETLASMWLPAFFLRCSKENNKLWQTERGSRDAVPVIHWWKTNRCRYNVTWDLVPILAFLSLTYFSVPCQNMYVYPFMESFIQQINRKWGFTVSQISVIKKTNINNILMIY